MFLDNTFLSINCLQIGKFLFIIFQFCDKRFNVQINQYIFFLSKYTRIVYFCASNFYFHYEAWFNNNNCNIKKRNNSNYSLCILDVNSKIGNKCGVILDILSIQAIYLDREQSQIWFFFQKRPFLLPACATCFWITI